MLNFHIADHIKLGAIQMNLGIVNMPIGYALMDSDGFSYWLRFDGLESVESWNKWAGYRGAKKDRDKIINI